MILLICMDGVGAPLFNRIVRLINIFEITINSWVPVYCNSKYVYLPNYLIEHKSNNRK